MDTRHGVLMLLIFLLAEPVWADVVFGDFDADGFQDLAIGCEEADVFSGTTGTDVEEAGVVHVLYGSPDGLGADRSQTFLRSDFVTATGPKDHFGAALAAGNFNGDLGRNARPIDDLAIGVPGARGGGSVIVIYGSRDDGLVAGDRQVISLSPNLFNASFEDAFGFALAAGNFNGDINPERNVAFDDLAISAPLDDFAVTTQRTLLNGGSVTVLYGSSSGLDRNTRQFWTQDSEFIEGLTEGGDQFGFALATGNFNGDQNEDTGLPIDDLAIGVPFEDLGLGLLGNEGAVNVIYGTPAGLSAANDQVWTQDTDGIKGETDGGDEFGSSLAAGNFDGDVSPATGLPIDDLAIGVPEETLGPAHIIGFSFLNQGAVNVIYGSPSGLTSVGDQVWTQDSEGIKGSAEGLDEFGEALVAGNFNGDTHPVTNAAIDDLAVGVPYESLGDFTAAGLVNLIFGSPEGLTAEGDQILHQDSSGIEGDAESRDRFGTHLAAGHAGGFGSSTDPSTDPFADLAVHVRDGEFGGVNIVYGAESGLIPEDNHLFLCTAGTVTSFFQVVNSPAQFPVEVDGAFGEPEWDGVEPWAFSLNGQLEAVEADDPAANSFVYSTFAQTDEGPALCSLYAFGPGGDESCGEGEFVASITFPALLNGDVESQPISVLLLGAGDGPIPLDDDVGPATCPVDVAVDLDGDGTGDSAADEFGIYAAAGFTVIDDESHLLVELCVAETLVPSGTSIVTAHIVNEGEATLASSAQIRLNNGILTATTNELAARIVSVGVEPKFELSPIAPASGQVVRVTVASTPYFDATEVDPDTVELVSPVDPGGRAAPIRVQEMMGDVVYSFSTHELAANQVITEGSTSVLLLGATFDGENIAGIAEFLLVPPQSSEEGVEGEDDEAAGEDDGDSNA